MSVNKYLDKFTQLSCYISDEVNTDPKRQERFLDGLIEQLNYQLRSHSFPNFATLLNKAIGLENKHAELGEQKRKFRSHGQSSNTHPRFNSSQNSQFYSGGSSGNYTKNLQHSTQQPQHSSQQTPHAPSHHQDRSEAPVRSNSPVRPNGCFNCGELGHYANICPKHNMQTPQEDIGQRFGQPLSQARIGNSSYRGNRGQRNYTRGRVNHVTAEEAQDAPGVVLGTFSVNSIPATVLFDSGASHSFITEQFVVKHDIPMSSMKTYLLISSLNGEMKSTYICPQVNLKNHRNRFSS
jgi:hypothetical protein